MTLAYCGNPDCSNWNEPIEIPWASATYWEPGYPLIEDCPACGHELHDDALQVDAIITEIQDGLGDHFQPKIIDDRALMKVIIEELKRQHHQQAKQATEQQTQPAF